ncbi:MAG: hypothetical protein PHC67_08785 [Methanoculleus sp.]|nr:hypothetical protein [Methanoculleus sp.]MDD2788147.1 hypothetical protein [Methanoculleus sp.]
MTTQEHPGGVQRVKLSRIDQEYLEDRETVARGIIRRMLVQFHREWTDLAEQERDGAWVLAANTLLDRYSHQLYDIIRDLEAIVDDDLAAEIRGLSAEMIKTTNILIMIDCREECRRQGDALAKEALRHTERCLALRRAAARGR